MGKNEITSSGELGVTSIYWLLYLPDTIQRTDIRKRSWKDYIYKGMIALNSSPGRDISSRVCFSNTLRYILRTDKGMDN
jgi:hypothetical protein